MKGLGREGELDLEGLRQAQDVQVEDVADAQLLVPVAGTDEAVEQDVQCRRTEAVKLDHVVVGPHGGIGADGGAHPLHEGLHLLGRCVIGEAQRGLVAAPGAGTHVVDYAVRHMHVGDGHAGVVEGADLGGAQVGGQVDVGV